MYTTLVQRGRAQQGNIWKLKCVGVFCVAALQVEYQSVREKDSKGGERKKIKKWDLLDCKFFAHIDQQDSGKNAYPYICVVLTKGKRMQCLLSRSQRSNVKEKKGWEREQAGWDMSKRTSEVLTFSSQLSTIVDSRLLKEEVFGPFCGSEYTKKTDCVCVRCVQSCLFSVWAHCRCSVFSGCMWRCVSVCVCVLGVGRCTRVPPVLSHVAQQWHCESLNRRHMRNTHTDGHSAGPGPAVHFGWHSHTVVYQPHRMTHRHDDHRTFSKRHACIIKTGAENIEWALWVCPEQENRLHFSSYSTKELMNWWPLIQLTLECHMCLT